MHSAVGFIWRASYSDSDRIAEARQEACFSSLKSMRCLFGSFITCITFDRHISRCHSPLSSQCDALLAIFWPLICRNNNHNVFILNMKDCWSVYTLPLWPVPPTAGFHQATNLHIPPSEHRHKSSSPPHWPKTHCVSFKKGSTLQETQPTLPLK